jgi:hypothetical protein
MKQSSLFSLLVGDKVEKCFKTLTPGANVIKLFCPLLTDFRNKLECLYLSSIISLV